MRMCACTGCGVTHKYDRKGYSRSARAYCDREREATQRQISKSIVATGFVRYKLTAFFLRGQVSWAVDKPATLAQKVSFGSVQSLHKAAS